MTKPRVMYMHTLDGLPATFEAKPWPSLIRIQQPSRIFPRAVGLLVRSRRTLKAQQSRCRAALRRGSQDFYRYGYVRVEVPRV